MLSWIASDFFRQSPLLFYPILALAIFMTVFFATALRVALFADKAHIDKLSRLPLEEDQNHE
jgi:hypothetical protein